MGDACGASARDVGEGEEVSRFYRGFPEITTRDVFLDNSVQRTWLDDLSSHLRKGRGQTCPLREDFMSCN